MSIISRIRRTSFRKSGRQVWPFNKMFSFVMLFHCFTTFSSLILIALHSKMLQRLVHQENNDFIFYQIQQLWGKEVTVSGHHGTWENKNIPWLWPENKPLPKKFRSGIHETHLNELLKTDWTREKVRNIFLSALRFFNLLLIF